MQGLSLKQNLIYPYLGKLYLFMFTISTKENFDRTYVISSAYIDVKKKVKGSFSKVKD